MNSKLLIAVVIFTVGCNSARAADHSSILEDKGKTVRIVVLDASSRPIAGTNIEVGECGGQPCSIVAPWTQKSGPDGAVTLPRNLIHENTLIGTRANEPRHLQAASWDKERGAWALRLMGRAATVCSHFDSSQILLVAEDWSSAKIEDMDDSGLMHCEEGKDVFCTCEGPEMPDGAFKAIFTRDGGKIFARLMAGPKLFAQLNCHHLAGMQSPPEDLKSWTVEYSLTGGIAFFNRHLRLSNTGELTVSANPDTSPTLIRTHAPAELVVKISGFLKNAQPERPTSGPIPPDPLNMSLALISRGSKYNLAIPEDIGQALDDAMESVLKTAVVGTWSESGWKLCRPAAQLTTDQMDPPIDSLIFLPNGQFSVAWRGGGARAYGDPNGKIPHTAVPDYSGKYSLLPDHSSIHMTFENGIYNPRDYSGDGFFRVDGDKLVLRNVWLGTYKAKQKPDICEMTFRRTSG